MSMVDTAQYLDRALRKVFAVSLQGAAETQTTPPPVIELKGLAEVRPDASAVR